MITRFAPSPTGPLHLGHAFSALTAWDLAQASGGRFLLRIEDIDSTRCRPEWDAAIRRDLTWLGLRWPEPVLRQSARLGAYRAALDRLGALGLTYVCTCTRADIRACLAAPQEGQRLPGPYPGTCRAAGRRGPGAVRLNLDRALAAAGSLFWVETGPEQPGRHRVDPDALARELGDVILARRDIGTAYHLAVVVDDAHQGITHVVRGRDLIGATPLHRLLQALLGLPVPVWHHHRLIRDDQGRRLAKRDDARAIAAWRAQGASPATIRAMTGLPPAPQPAWSK